MKITKKNLQNLIEEEIEAFLSETNAQEDEKKAAELDRYTKAMNTARTYAEVYNADPDERAHKLSMRYTRLCIERSTQKSNPKTCAAAARFYDAFGAAAKRAKAADAAAK